MNDQSDETASPSENSQNTPPMPPDSPSRPLQSPETRPESKPIPKAGKALALRGARSKRAAAKPATAAKGKAAALSEQKTGRRPSQVAHFKSDLVTVLRKGPQTVASLAARFKTSPRLIRQAIDSARRDNVNILRTEKNTFGFKMKG